MIDMKAAVDRAIEEFKALFDGMDYSSIAPEEIEPSDDGGSWMITIGYNLPDTPDYQKNMMAAAFAKKIRHYKVLKIDAANGSVLSVKMRNPWAERSAV